MTPTITIKADLCIRCGLCVEDCPHSLFVQENENALPSVLDLETCLSCGHCTAVCPSDAIRHSDYPEGSVRLINQKIIPSPEATLELIRTRRSIRVFQNKPVEKQKIELLIDTARFAPSGHNRQSIGYILVQDKKILGELVRGTVRVMSRMVTMARNPFIKPVIAMMLGKQAAIFFRITPDRERLVNGYKNGEDRILRNAPTLLIFHGDEASPMRAIGAQLAIQNTTLMAYSLGLGCFYTGYLLQAVERDKSMRQLIKLPAGHKMYGGLAIGYPKYEFNKWMERNPPAVTWL